MANSDLQFWRFCRWYIVFQNSSHSKKVCCAPCSSAFKSLNKPCIILFQKTLYYIIIQPEIGFQRKLSPPLQIQLFMKIFNICFLMKTALSGHDKATVDFFSVNM